MRLRLFASVGIIAILAISIGCLSTSSSSSSTSSGARLLYVTTLGNTAISSFGVDDNTGLISRTGGTAASGTNPIAMAVAPNGGTAFVLNDAGSAQNGTVSAFTLGSDGTIKAAGTPQSVGLNPKALLIDPSGHFLFVANQGTFVACSPGTSSGGVVGSVSVFAIQSATLTPVGNPAEICLPTAVNTPGSGNFMGTGPAGIALTPDGKFLYVANQFNNTVTAFSVDSGGNLTQIAGSAQGSASPQVQGSPFATGTAPTALAVTPDGAFLYVANFGSNNVSAFAICGQVVTSCANASSPDGSLTQVTGSPFSAGVGPVALVTSPAVTYLNAGNPLAYLYVVDQNGNQISEFQIGTSSGRLSPLADVSIATGPSPVSIVSHFGNTTGTTTTDFVYVANQGGSSISTYAFDVSTGVLRELQAPTAVNASQPTALGIQ